MQCSVQGSSTPPWCHLLQTVSSDDVVGPHIAWSGDGQRIATSCATDSLCIGVWDAASGALLSSLKVRSARRTASASVQHCYVALCSSRAHFARWCLAAVCARRVTRAW